MAWFKVDDGFTNSKPVLKISRRYRAAAVGLWTLAGAWSAKELTDGFVPDYIIEEVASTVAIAGVLVKVGLWEVAEDGWQFVGWKKYQPMRDQVLAARAAEAERKRVARNSNRNPNVNGSRSHPDSTPDETQEPDNSTLLPGETQFDQQQYEMSHPDTARTKPGVRQTSTPESGHPDPTRPLSSPKGEDIPVQKNPPSLVSNARGVEKTRGRTAIDRLNSTAHSAEAFSIISRYETATQRAVTSANRTKMGTAIDECLNGNYSELEIENGILEWERSDSWSPTQIPNFVHKWAANQRNPKISKNDQKVAAWLQTAPGNSNPAGDNLELLRKEMGL